MDKVFIATVFKHKLKYNDNPIHDVMVILAKDRDEAYKLAKDYNWPEDIWLKNSRTEVRVVFELDEKDPALRYRLVKDLEKNQASSLTFLKDSLMRGVKEVSSIDSPELESVPKKRRVRSKRSPGRQIITTPKTRVRKKIL